MEQRISIVIPLPSGSSINIPSEDKSINTKQMLINTFSSIISFFDDDSETKKALIIIEGTSNANCFLETAIEKMALLKKTKDDTDVNVYTSLSYEITKDGFEWIISITDLKIKITKIRATWHKDENDGIASITYEIEKS